MPEYLYQNPETKEVISVIQGMNDNHQYIDDAGMEWKRVFTNTSFSLDSTNIDPFSEKQFIEKTGKMKGTYGDMLDYSRDLSRQRSEILGKEDPIKRNSFDNFKKQRGFSHPNDKPKPKTIDTPTYRVDY